LEDDFPLGWYIFEGRAVNFGGVIIPLVYCGSAKLKDVDDVSCGKMWQGAYERCPKTC